MTTLMQVWSFSGTVLPGQKKEYEASKLTYHSGHWKNEDLSWIEAEKVREDQFWVYDVADGDS